MQIAAAAFPCLFFAFAGASFAADEGGGLSLEQAVAAAIAQNGLIRISSIETSMAAYRSAQARSPLLPQVMASATSLTLDREPTMRFGGLDIPVGDKSTRDLNLKVSQILFDFGGSWSGFKGARLAEEAAMLRHEQLRRQVALMAAERYFQLHAAERNAEVAGDAFARSEAGLKRAEDFFGQGLVDQVDVLRSRLQLSRDRQALIQAENAAAMAASALNRVMGRDLEEKTRLARLPPRPAEEKRGLEEFCRLASSRRGDLLALEKQMRSATNMARSAAAAGAPSISAFWNGDWKDDDFAVRDKSWNAGLQLQMPLFTGGRMWHAAREARDRERLAREALEEARRDLMLELKQAYLSREEAGKLLLVSEDGVREAEENLRRTQDLYEHQSATSADLIEARSFRSSALGFHASAACGLHIAAARLEIASGGWIPSVETPAAGKAPEKQDELREKK